MMSYIVSSSSKSWYNISASTGVGGSDVMEGCAACSTFTGASWPDAGLDGVSGGVLPIAAGSKETSGDDVVRSRAGRNSCLGGSPPPPLARSGIDKDERPLVAEPTMTTLDMEGLW